MGIFESFIIGILIAAIPGPIFFEIIRRILTKNFSAGFLVSIGDFIGNFLILSLIFFGASNFLNSELSKMLLFLIGGLILIYLGVSAFFITKKEIEISYHKSNSKNNSIFTGFIIAISSPIVIAFWISLSGSYLLQFPSTFLAFFNIFIIAFSFIIFYLILALIVNFTKHKIPPKKVLLLSKISGLFLFFYGIYFLYKMILMIV